eukprot:GHVN01008486.1.p1 GENE.GHVN01008486.1~~GHVN01008486.1.p1  ORF type:complete len:152 (-),score=38.55 GHVN01008486.1:126-581(-)
MTGTRAEREMFVTERGHREGDRNWRTKIWRCVVTGVSELLAQSLLTHRPLQNALPHLHAAESAISSIASKDISELRTIKNPPDIVKLVLDGVLILRQMKVCEVKAEKKVLVRKSGSVDFIKDSFDDYGRSCLFDGKMGDVGKAAYGLLEGG